MCGIDRVISRPGAADADAWIGIVQLDSSRVPAAERSPRITVSPISGGQNMKRRRYVRTSTNLGCVESRGTQLVAEVSCAPLHNVGSKTMGESAPDASDSINGHLTHRGKWFKHLARGSLRPSLRDNRSKGAINYCYGQFSAVRRGVDRALFRESVQRTPQHAAPNQENIPVTGNTRWGWTIPAFIAFIESSA